MASEDYFKHVWRNRILWLTVVILSLLVGYFITARKKSLNHSNQTYQDAFIYLVGDRVASKVQYELCAS
jgi:hypothetical protein